MTHTTGMRIEAMDGQPTAARSVEFVERKGRGHPDTICDLLSERLSISLSRYYLDRFGQILHHNVDKALLRAGHTEPAFGGGPVIEPIEIYLAGRATTTMDGEQIPITELARDCVFGWFRENFHGFDPDKHVRVHCLVRQGSRELVDVFQRRQAASVLLANDTSFGVGFAPLTPLEQTVLEVERTLNSQEVKAVIPASGQDIKVMGVRDGDAISLTISCAFIARYLDGPKAYAEAKSRVAAHARERAQVIAGVKVAVTVNAADDPDGGAIFLTETGTSAEAGDDGETGRGNRANGLITPFRPMTLEAVAGKNPLTHIGKLYNVAAQQLAEAVVREVAEVLEAECFLVNQIGAPIDRPTIALVRARTEAGVITPDTARQIEDVTERQVAGIRDLWTGFLDGRYRIT